MNWSTRRAIMGITGAMVGILLLLAYLQYNWLGQLSDKEFERMQSTLRTAAFDASMTFSREMTALLRSLGGPMDGSLREMRNEIRARVASWHMSGTRPSLLSDSIFIATAPSGETAITIQYDERSTLYLYRDLSAVALPLGGPRNQIIGVLLNDSTITCSLIPDILHRFSLLNGSYEIAILDDRGRPFFLSDSNAVPSDMKRADAVVPFLTFPPGPIAMIDGGGPRQGDAYPPPQKRNHGEGEPRPPGERDRDRTFDRMGGRPRDPGPGQAALLTLGIRHRDGSLEAVVKSNRRRNLAVSFGILLLLGATVVSLLSAAGRAQQLARQQLDFVAAVSHELRTPLAVLNSAGENLADGVVSNGERSQQYGELIKEEVSRLSSMVERTLSYAGIQSGKGVHRVRPVNISALIDSALREVQKRLLGEKLDAELSVEPGLPSLHGDPYALQSALENLLANALKYSPEKKWLGVRAGTMMAGKTRGIEVAISDRGIGILPADVDRIFEPFYRGRNAIEDQVRGSGLGLTIAKHVIEAHGGTISVSSTLGMGSTFTIMLPVADHQDKKE